MVVAILDKKDLNNKYLELNIDTKIDINKIYMDILKSIDIKVNLEYLSLSDKVVLLIANISNCKEKNILIVPLI